MAGLTGRKILVTGGTGFVGSHLVEKLVNAGAHVVVPHRSIDPSSYFVTQKMNTKVILVSGDLKDGRRVSDIVTKYEIQDIFHLGAQAIVDTAYYNPVETIETNVMGTTHILHAAWESGTVQRIVVTSSDKAYGKSENVYTETSPMAGDHPYEVSKSASDLIAQSYIKTYNAPITIVRFGNIYGPGDLSWSRIVPSIMRTAVTGQTLHVRSDGTFIRDYVYVKDVVAAYAFLLGTDRGIFNVSSDTSISVVSLIEEAQKILGKKIPYVIDNVQKNEIPHQHLDWSKIQSLGWKPAHSLEQGLLATFEWYKKYV